MSEQAELFDPAATAPVACPVGHCQAIRLPGQQQVVTCAHDLQPPTDRPYRRPRGCLNRGVPNQFPEGY